MVCSYINPSCHMLTTSRAYLDNIRRNPGPFTAEDFDTSEEAVTAIERMNILLVNLNSYI